MNSSSDLSTREENHPASDLYIIAGMAAPVVTLTAWLMSEKFRLRRITIFSTIQGINILRTTVEHAGFPPHIRPVWRGNTVDGNDGEHAQKQFCHVLDEAFSDERGETALQVVLGGGVNWMISLASQYAAMYLEEARGDGLWVLRTDPRFEHHPHFLKPDDPARAWDHATASLHQADGASRMQRVLLPGKGIPRTPGAREQLRCTPDGIHFLGRLIRLRPLQHQLYKWILMQTKERCQRPQLPACSGCFACAMPAKQMAALCKAFFTFYQTNTSKPGYVRTMEPAEFLERIPEYISKINSEIKKQGNAVLLHQLRINNTDGGYLPAVEKHYLGREE
ncbi:MAG: hypothetical protein HQL63_11940 [Magnetococcales bacterium]|nr:hypothetical protein [Magnetococcales bacterium]MBF0321544.1 hypothetical protein [Magnetococcales bacterium]